MRDPKKVRSRRPVTSSSTRSSRSKTSAKSADKKTTSSGRGAGKRPNVDSRAQRQKTSTAKVTSSGGGTPGSAKVTSSRRRGERVKASKPNITASSGGSARTPGGPNAADANRWKEINKNAAKQVARENSRVAPGSKNAPNNAKPVGPRNPKSQVAANKMKRVLAKSAEARANAARAGTLSKIGKAGGLASVAAAGLTSRNTADGTLKGKPTGPKQGPKAPKRLTQPGIDSKSFDDAFRAARKAGQKKFTWRGKSYTTKMA